MSGDTVQHLADVLDAHAPVNNTEVFHYLLNVREQAWDIIRSSLNLREDRKCQDIQHIPRPARQHRGKHSHLHRRADRLDCPLLDWQAGNGLYQHPSYLLVKRGN